MTEIEIQMLENDISIMAGLVALLAGGEEGRAIRDGILKCMDRSLDVMKAERLALEAKP